MGIRYDLDPLHENSGLMFIIFINIVIRRSKFISHSTNDFFFNPAELNELYICDPTLLETAYLNTLCLLNLVCQNSTRCNVSD